MRKKSLEKYLAELEKNDEDRLFVCNDGVQIVGNIGSVLSLFSILVKHMKDQCPEIGRESFEFAFDLGFKTDEELRDMAKERAAAFMKDLKKSLDILSQKESEKKDNE